MSGSRFKERFSLQSLLPARHAPLNAHPSISNPIPLASSRPRPPPLNLSVTKKAFRHPVNVIIDTEPSPLYEEVESTRAGVGTHRQASVRPGEIYPAEALPLSMSKGKHTRTELLKPEAASPATMYSTSSQTLAPQQYESVLHNVLLTPTYNGPSPILSPAYTETDNTAASSTISLHPQPVARTKRQTILNRVADLLPVRMQGQASDVESGDRHLRSLERLREREEQEMDRYRAMMMLARNHPVAPSPVNVSELKRPKVEWGDSRGSIRSQVPSWHTVSHARGSNVVPSGYGGDFYRAGEKKDRTAALEKQKKRKQRLWKIVIVCIILALTVLTVVLCTTLLNKSSNATPPVTSDASDVSTSPAVSASTSEPSRASTTTSSPQPIASTSQTLQSCLSQLSTLAPTNPLSYPCSDCVPLFESTNNDYLSPLAGANSTGVGAALQFCALREVLELTGTKGNGSIESSLRDGGWGRDASPCGGWQGVSCDDRGRLTGLTLKYPSVPNTLPVSLKNLVALRSLTIVGSGSIPTGTFPNALMALQNLSAIDIEQTALTGPLDGDAFGKAGRLLSLSFVGNKYLGTAMPNLGASQELLTLVVTGQGLKESPIQYLSNKLTYLDLSYNSLSGTIPSTTHLTSLNTLYLDSNAFTSPPTQSFPSSLQSLSLNSNPSLAGQLPNTLCATQLGSCDLRGTNLGPGNTGNATRTTSITTLSSGSATVSTTVSTGTAVPSCGVCKFN